MSFSRLERLEERLERRRRVNRIPVVRLKDRENPLELYNSEQFKIRFHIFKETAIFISAMIEHDICAPLKRGVHIPPLIQFVTAMRFYVTGSFQINIGDLNQLAQPTVSKIIRRVSLAISKRRQQFISFPGLNIAHIVREKFYNIGGFPGVTGVIDGCQIKIISPGGENAELFRNRKDTFSINVQGVCDSDMNFTNIVARWYGSAHDSRVFENSLLYGNLEEGSAPGWLIGDSGYPLLGFVMVPLRNPTTAGERRYQRSILKTRNLIERCFGIWKKRFPCLNLLRLKLKNTLTVIVATAILHNISRSRMDLFHEVEFDVEDFPHVPCSSSSTVGRTLQRTLINTHFTQ